MTIDITEILDGDDDLSTCFDVIRRTEVVSEDDGVSRLDAETFHGVEGVVEAIDPKDNARSSDMQMTNKAIQVCTMWPLRAASEGVQPDQVVVNGTTYTVVAIKDHSNWGAGWVKVQAMSQNASDTPLPLGNADGY